MKKLSWILTAVIIVLAILCATLWQRNTVEENDIKVMCKSSVNAALEHFEEWQTIKRILNIITGVSGGCYIGRILWVIVDYKMHTDLYASYSAPWYTPIITASIFWGVVILIEVIALLFVRHKATAGPIIGVIERKD